jgi:hypothetical protein
MREGRGSKQGASKPGIPCMTGHALIHHLLLAGFGRGERAREWLRVCVEAMSPGLVKLQRHDGELKDNHHTQGKLLGA